jgi:hypothetical protein
MFDLLSQIQSRLQVSPSPLYSSLNHHCRWPHPQGIFSHTYSLPISHYRVVKPRVFADVIKCGFPRAVHTISASFNHQNHTSPQPRISLSHQDSRSRSSHEDSPTYPNPQFVHKGHRIIAVIQANLSISSNPASRPNLEGPWLPNPRPTLSSTQEISNLSALGRPYCPVHPNFFLPSSSTQLLHPVLFML